MEIRNPAVSGTFYPESKDELKKDIELYLDKAKKVSIKNVKAIIVPHAGYSYSGIVAASGYNLLRQLPKKHYKVILLGPAHYIAFYGISTSKAGYWSTPLGKVKITKSNFEEIPGSHLYEHSLEVQIPFLQKTLSSFEILPLLLNEIDPKTAANQIINLIDSSTIIIASSDLSHFYDYKTAVSIDSMMNESIPDIDIAKASKGEACGKSAILTLMNIAKLKNWQSILLDYKNSGDITKNKKSVVGYGCYAFY